MQKEPFPPAERQATEILNGNGYQGGNWAPSAATAVAGACLRCGYSEADYIALVERSALGKLLSDRTEFRDKPSKLESFLRRMWSHTEDTYNPSIGSRESVSRSAAALFDRVFWADWPGTGVQRETDRMVALALVAQATDRGAWTFHATVRYIGRLVGSESIDLLSQSRSRVAATGLYTLRGRGQQKREVILDLGWQSPSSRARLGTNKSYASGLFVPNHAHPGFHHDLFCRGRGLPGPSAGWTLAVAEAAEGPISPDALPEVIGVSKRTARKALDALRELEIAEVNNRGIVSTGIDLDSVAESIGVLGRKQRIRERLAAEEAANRSERMEWYGEEVQREAEAHREQAEAFRAISAVLRSDVGSPPEDSHPPFCECSECLTVPAGRVDPFAEAVV